MSSPFHFLFGKPPSQEELEAQRTKSEMEAADFKNNVKHLIDDLSIPHLITLRELLHLIQMNDNLPVYLEGLITGCLQVQARRVSVLRRRPRRRAAGNAPPGCQARRRRTARASFRGRQHDGYTV